MRRTLDDSPAMLAESARFLRDVPEAELVAAATCGRGAFEFLDAVDAVNRIEPCAREGPRSPTLEPPPRRSAAPEGKR